MKTRPNQGDDAGMIKKYKEICEIVASWRSDSNSSTDNLPAAYAMEHIEEIIWSAKPTVHTPFSHCSACRSK